MLVLTVKANESIQIGEAIITVEGGAMGGRPRVYIDAPQSVKIERIPRKIKGQRYIKD